MHGSDDILARLIKRFCSRMVVYFCEIFLNSSVVSFDWEFANVIIVFKIVFL